MLPLFHLLCPTLLPALCLLPFPLLASLFHSFSPRLDIFFLIVLTRCPLPLRFPVPFPKRFPVCLFCKPHRSVRTLTALSSLAVSPPLCIRFANFWQFEKCKLLCLGSYRTYLGSYRRDARQIGCEGARSLLGSASEAKLSERNLGRESHLHCPYSISELLLLSPWLTGVGSTGRRRAGSGMTICRSGLSISGCSASAGTEKNCHVFLPLLFFAQTGFLRS